MGFTERFFEQLNNVANGKFIDELFNKFGPDALEILKSVGDQKIVETLKKYDPDGVIFKEINNLINPLENTQKLNSSKDLYTYPQFRSYLTGLGRGLFHSKSIDQYPGQIELSDNFHQYFNTFRGGAFSYASSSRQENIWSFIGYNFEKHKLVVPENPVNNSFTGFSLTEQRFTLLKSILAHSGVTKILGKIQRNSNDNIGGLFDLIKSEDPEELLVTIFRKDNMFILRSAETAQISSGAGFLDRPSFYNFWHLQNGYGRNESGQLEKINPDSTPQKVFHAIVNNYKLVYYSGAVNKNLTRVYPKYAGN